MFPAIPLAVRIGGPIALAALLAGGWYLYKESLRDEGREQAQQEFDTQIAEQIEYAKEFEKSQYEATIGILKRQMAEKEEFDAKVRAVLASREAENTRLKTALDRLKEQSPEVIYETRTETVEVDKPVIVDAPCVVSWADVNTVDDLTRVLNEIPYDRVPDVQPAGQRGDLSGPSSVPCAAFTKRVTELTSRLGHALIQWRTMSEHAWSQYRLQEAFQKGLRDEVERATRPHD